MACARKRRGRIEHASKRALVLPQVTVLDRDNGVVRTPEQEDGTLEILKEIAYPPNEAVSTRKRHVDEAVHHRHVFLLSYLLLRLRPCGIGVRVVAGSIRWMIIATIAACTGAQVGPIREVLWPPVGWLALEHAALETRRQEEKQLEESLRQAETARKL